MSTVPPNQLWGRKASLVVAPDTGNSPNALNANSATGSASSPFTFSTTTHPPALDLSQFHFTFDITYSDVPTPNTAIFRIYNLGPQTIDSIMSEYVEVALQAGYETGANYGTVFQGNITQFRRGRENDVDSFLEIYAADGDVPYNFGFVNFSLPAGATPAQHLSSVGAAVGLKVDPQAVKYLNALGGVAPRGIVFLGLARAQLNVIAKSSQSRWSIQNGVLTLIPLTGYLPGDPVVLNSFTGMVGIPEALDKNQGLKVRSLINARIQIGQRVQINDQDITYTATTQQYYKNGVNQDDPAYATPVVRNGIYRVMVINHTGDTRGTPWYSDMTCLACDDSAVAGDIINPDYSVVGTLGSVQGYGG